MDMSNSSKLASAEMNNAAELQRPRILFIVPHPPYPTDGGAAQRTNLLYQALSRIGDVDLFVIGHGINRPSFAEAKKRFKIVGAVAPSPRGSRGLWRGLRAIHPRIVDLVATAFGRRSVDYSPDPAAAPLVAKLIEGGRYSLIAGRYLRWTAKAGVIGREQVIVDIDDIDTDVYRTRLEKPGVGFAYRALFRSHLRQATQIMARLLPKITAVFVTSDEDAARLDHARSYIVRNLPFGIVENPKGEFIPPSEGSKVVLFVGTYSHRVNREGVIRFINEYWPAVRRLEPDAVFRIVGSGAWENIRPDLKDTEGVEIVGFVEDLVDAYRECAFVIAPLFEGGGTKIKVVESLYYGRAAVSTSHASKGYSKIIESGGVRVANTESDLVEMTVQMLRSPEECNRMAKAGIDAVLEQFGFEQFCTSVSDAAERVILESQSVD